MYKKMNLAETLISVHLVKDKKLRQDLFIKFLHRQAFYTYAVAKPDFSDFG